MTERQRPDGPIEQGVGGGLGNPFAMGDVETVTVDHGVYREDLPLAGRTVAEIRRIVGPRYRIPPAATAYVGGNPLSEDTVVQAGQEVHFEHFAGEKGQHGHGQADLYELLGLDDVIGSPASIQEALQARGGRSRPRRSPPRITIEGETVEGTTPEGRTATMGLEDLLSRLERRGPSPGDFGDFVLPDGVKWIHSARGLRIVVHQTPPAVHSLQWIANDSPRRHGPGTTYRRVSIALPYVIVLAVFEHQDKPRVGESNECFFRNEPLRSPDDSLCYPALLNCSKFDRPDRPLSWICTQYLRRTPVSNKAGINHRLRQGLQDLLHCMLQTGFNYSSEENELTSWFSESRNVDPRVSTIERWEQATREDPAFVMELPWLPVGKSLRQVAERIVSYRTGRHTVKRSSHELARIVFNHGEVAMP